MQTFTSCARSKIDWPEGDGLQVSMQRRCSLRPDLKGEESTIRFSFVPTRKLEGFLPTSSVVDADSLSKWSIGHIHRRLRKMQVHTSYQLSDTWEYEYDSRFRQFSCLWQTTLRSLWHLPLGANYPDEFRVVIDYRTSLFSLASGEQFDPFDAWFKIADTEIGRVTSFTPFLRYAFWHVPSILFPLSLLHAIFVRWIVS